MADELKPMAEQVRELLKRVERALAQAPEQTPTSPNGPRPWEEEPSFRCPRCGNRGVYQHAIRNGAAWFKRCRVPECVKARKAQASPRAGGFIDQQENKDRGEIL